jgi:hypothetical protein
MPHRRMTANDLTCQIRHGPVNVRNRRILLVPPHSGGGRLTERTPAVQPRRRERVKVPLKRPCWPARSRSGWVVSRPSLRRIGVTGRIWHYPAPISIVEGGPVRSDPGDTAECASYASQQSHGSRKRVSRRGALLPSAGRSGKLPRRRSYRFSLRRRPRPYDVLPIGGCLEVADLL